MFNVPQEAIDKSYITIYSDTPRELINSVDDYNELMNNLRVQYKKMTDIENAFMMINILFAGAMLAFMPQTVFAVPAVGVSANLVFFLFFVFFGVLKRNFIPVTAVTLFFLFIDIKYLILFVLDAVISFLHQKLYEYLITQPGYPDFRDITVKHERIPTPDYLKNKTE